MEKPSGISKEQFQKRRRVRKGKAIFYFFIFIICAALIGYGSWHGLKAYYAPWGSALESGHKRLPSSYSDTRFFSLLIIGIGNSKTESGFSEADSFIFFMIDKENRNCSVIFLPKNTQVTQDENIIESLADVYEKSGKVATIEAIEQMLQIPIQHYLVFQPGSMQAFVDAMGGFEVFVSADMRYSDPYMDPPLEINLKKGTQTLNGEQALQFLRYRSDELEDLGRLKRQQVFIKSFQEQMERPQKMVRFPWMMWALKNQAETDMSLSHFVQISWSLFRAESKSIEILPGYKENNEWIMDRTEWGEKGRVIAPLQILQE